MVLTIELTEDGGFSFTNGSLDLVGSSDEESSEEVEQRVRIRLETGLGEDNWHPEVGFDFEGLQQQVPQNADVPYTKEEVIRLNVIKTMAQDPAVEIDELFIERDEELRRNFNIKLTFHTINEQGLNLTVGI